jgi:hypothetical protein
LKQDAVGFRLPKPREDKADGYGPEMHEYSSLAPPVEAKDDGVVPPLVIRARQMGLDV